MIKVISCLWMKEKRCKLLEYLFDVLAAFWKQCLTLTSGSGRASEQIQWLIGLAGIHDSKVKAFLFTIACPLTARLCSLF